MRIIRQIFAVARINIRSLPRRPGMALTTLLASAIVVGVLLAFLAMADGFERTVAGAGAADVAVVMRPGSQSELNSVITRDQLRLLENTPFAARDEKGRALISPELYVIVDGTKKRTGTPANVPLRGVRPIAAELRDNFRLVAGRMFETGRNEIIAGRALLESVEGLELGKEIRFGSQTWTLVGIFETGGSVFESELWGDLATVQSRFNRGGSVQAVRIRLESPDKLDELNAWLDADPQLKLEARSEKDYLARLAEATVLLIRWFGWPTAIIMTIGALAGALNTMYAAVAGRMREIATLRAIGFSGFAAFVGTMLESLVLAAIGGLVGSLGAFALFEGRTGSTLGGSFTQVVFSFHLTPAAVASGVVLAIVIGLLGGIFPGIRAARVPVTAAFRGQ
ncbi:MAG: FtsX-like permease family protein [Alphaproteobacteria bacterium]|nr:MAG: FtsX-like permease family protein [Alphaproteobacteria bacterium]